MRNVMYGWLGLILAVGLGLGGARPAAAATTAPVTVDPGNSLTVTCATRLTVKLSADQKSAVVSCAAAPATATATRVPATATQAPATATRVPATATRVPATATRAPATATATRAPATATATRVPATATQVPATPTATMAMPMPSATTAPAGGAVPAVDPLILGTCPAAVHDRYVVTGPDGQLYRTWHPAVVPLDVANPASGTCAFAHEHGDDPATSLANAALPPFGYLSGLAGMLEPHEGFKVFVANRGVVNDEGRTAQTSTRVVFHMGTGGIKRFTEQHHSLMFDLIAPDGHFVHVQGMADTSLVGSICDRDRSLQDSNSANDVGRTVVVVKGAGCDVGSLYEIWAITLNVAGRLQVQVSTAVFDPITVMNPADKTQLVYTSTQYPGEYHGCDRESYSGPVYWYNGGSQTLFATDAFGQLVTSGPVRQEISNHTDIGIKMSPDQNLFKLHVPQCGPGLGLKN